MVLEGAQERNISELINVSQTMLRLIKKIMNIRQSELDEVNF